METIFIDTENSKTNELHIYVLNLSQRLDLNNSNKHVALQNLSKTLKPRNFTLGKIKKQYKTINS